VSFEDVHLHPMIGENRQLVADEPVEVQDCRKITDRFRGIYRIYSNLIKENRRMSTCNWLHLQTLGSQPVMYKISPIIAYTLTLESNL
jgi:hypothetical protein